MQRLTRREVITGLAAGAMVTGLTPLTASSAGVSRPVPTPPPVRREFRAAWVATVDNIDWPSKPALIPDQQRAEIRRIVLAAERTGLNALILQVRPTADAIYPSRLEPWSAFLTGAQGRAPAPPYDPLEAWLEEAHARGLDLHAWINPFRARHPKSIGPDDRTHVAIARPDLVRRHGPFLWLDPGVPAAREHSLAVTADLLRRYPIDGVHMDDYFYPYPREKEPFPDADTHARHARGKPLADWRRDNINAFLLETARLVRTTRPGAIFTVSPFGIWRPDHPPGVKGFDAFAGLHADSRHWLVEGWVDALMPQLYWPIESPGQPFEPLLDWWRAQNRQARHLWPGLYLTRIKPAGEKDSWEPDQIIRQIERTRSRPDTPGVVLFSMIGILDNRRAVADRLAETFTEPALVPASPWAPAPYPSAPGAAITDRGRTLHLTPRPGRAEPRRWIVQSLRGGSWTTRILPHAERRLALDAPAESFDAILVSACAGNGATSPSVAVRL